MEFLKKLLDDFKNQKAELASRAAKSDSADEVRSINVELEKINEKISEIETEIRNSVPAGAQKVNGGITRAAYKTGEVAEDEPENYFGTKEYRSAFKKYVQTGAMIKRAGETITTEDTGAAIPLTVMDRVINTVRKRYGALYGKVTKTYVKGGVQYPVGALQATARWINESTVSPTQKLGKLAKVMFGAHPLELVVAQSFLENILTLDDFEVKIAEAIAIAYLQAMDIAIVNGTGDGMPLGILNDTRLGKDNKITMTGADMNDWKAWRKKFFAKLPLGYRSGEFIFPLSTVDSYLSTMSDANGYPVFSQATGLVVGDGDAQNPGGAFFGRQITLVEPDVINDFDAAQAGDVVGIFWQPENYAVNENFGFTMRRYYDDDTNEWKTKALVVVDGKILNPTGYRLIVKG